MDYEKLVEIIKKEKEATSLSKVEEDFYKKLKELLEKKEKEKEKSPLFMIEYENIRRLVRKVVEIRTKKIMFLALNEIEAPNSTMVEKELYEELRRALKNFEEKVWREEEKGKESKEVVLNKEEEQGEEKGGEEEKEEKEQEGKSKEEKVEESREENKEAKEEEEKRIKIRSYVEAYRGIDGIIYGPYSPGEIVKINKEEAKWLVENGYAEFV